MHCRLKALPLAALTVVLLAGCGGGSIMPGIGTGGGLGTGGTGNPDATLIFRLRGSSLGDFEATEVKAATNIFGFQVQGSSTAGPTNGRITRVTTIRFNGLPVQGNNYTIGGTDPNGASVVYTEKNAQTTVQSVWEGNSGTIHVDRVTADHVDAKFDARLGPVQNSTALISITGGEIRVLYHN
jgi:hypothetical protein